MNSLPPPPTQKEREAGGRGENRAKRRLTLNGFMKDFYVDVKIPETPMKNLLSFSETHKCFSSSKVFLQEMIPGTIKHSLPSSTL